VIAALSSWHEFHQAAREALDGVDALPAHALLEAYSTLTRLPAGYVLTAAEGEEVLRRRFAQPPLRLDDAARALLVPRLAAAGVSGGAAYDGLVALEASAHGRTLLTLDRRAQATYQRLGIAYRAI
jgi:predicted nucleic acid-binding protein